MMQIWNFTAVAIYYLDRRFPIKQMSNRISVNRNICDETAEHDWCYTYNIVKPKTTLWPVAWNTRMISLYTNSYQY